MNGAGTIRPRSFRLSLLLRITERYRSPLDLLQGSRVLDGGWGFVLLAISDLAHGRPEDLTAACLGQTRYYRHILKTGQRTDFIPHHVHHFFCDLVIGSAHTGLQDHETDGHLALQHIVHPDDRTLGYIL